MRRVPAAVRNVLRAMLRVPLRGLSAAMLALIGACRGGFEEHLEAEPRAILAAPETLEALTILALEPRLDPGAALPPDVDAFRGYRVLGRADVPDPAERARLIELVEKGVSDAGDDVAACFAPRHGIRATAARGSVDLLICYECLRIAVWGPDGARREAPTATGVEGDVTALFEAHGLKIAR